MKYLKGKFKPRNPQKYDGDPTNIIYRSSYELKFMHWCDLTESVLEWSSEEFFIGYINPMTGKPARYFPDFKVKMKTKTGVEIHVIEIKPEHQLKAPITQQRKTKRYIHEVMTYTINKKKWEAAENYCKKKGYKFTKLTQKNLAIGI